MARPRRSHETRERLFEEGLRAFLAHGYNGTGIMEVVARAGVPKGSFYNYFDSKEQFAALLIERYTDLLLARMDAVTAGSGADPLETLRRLFNAEAAFHAKQGVEAGCLLCNLGAEIGGQSALCQAAVRRALAERQTRLATLLEAARKSGQVRQDIAAPELAQSLMDAWNGALIRMKAEGSLQPLARFTKIHLETLQAKK